MPPYHNGVTLLAIANGAEDLTSTIVAALAGETSDVARNPIYLAIGTLVGTAVFINMVVTPVLILKIPTAHPLQAFLFVEITIK